jgi:hypothetical protein
VLSSTAVSWSAVDTTIGAIESECPP